MKKAHRNKINETAMTIRNLHLNYEQTVDLLNRLAEVFYTQGVADGIREGRDLALKIIHETFNEHKHGTV